MDGRSFEGVRLIFKFLHFLKKFTDHGVFFGARRVVFYFFNHFFVAFLSLSQLPNFSFEVSILLFHVICQIYDATYIIQNIGIGVRACLSQLRDFLLILFDNLVLIL